MKMDRLHKTLKLHRGTYDTSINCVSSNIQYSEKEPAESKEPWIKCRYVVILMGFASEFFLYAQRMTMGVSIVAMVNNSALPKVEESKSESCLSLITNTSNEEHAGDYANKDGEFIWMPEIQGYILGSSFLCYAIATAPAGKLTELFGGKNILFWGFFLSSVFTILSPFAAWCNVYVLILVQSLRGLAQAGFVPSQSVLISNWCPKSERGFSYTLLLSGSCWGAVVGSYISGLLCNSNLLGGWPFVFFVFGGLGLIASLSIGFFTYDNPSVHPRISPAELKYITSNQENTLTQKRPDTPWKSLFTSVPLYALACAYFGQMWAISHFLTVHPTFLGTILYYPIEKNGILNSLQFMLQFLTSLGAASLSTFLNNKNYMSVDTARKFWNFMSCLGYSVCLLGIYFAGCKRSVSVPFAIVALACTGFGNAGCWITSADMSPTFAASVNAISCTLGFTSNFIMPVLVGFLTDGMQTIEQWNKIFLISIGVVMSSGVIFAVFGSAEVQSWNFVKENEIDKSNLKKTIGCQEECYI